MVGISVTLLLLQISLAPPMSKDVQASSRRSKAAHRAISSASASGGDAAGGAAAGAADAGTARPAAIEARPPPRSAAPACQTIMVWNINQPT
jgi:hypothetical protein